LFVMLLMLVLNLTVIRFKVVSIPIFLEIVIKKINVSLIAAIYNMVAKRLL